MTLLVAIRSFGANWSAEAWQKRFAERLGDRPVRLATERDIDPGAVRYIAAWKPVPGSLARFPNLAAIFNLGAGVDALLADQALPDVPIVRVVDQNLTRRMTEYIVLHVLYHHRQMPRLLGAQSRSHWDAPDQPFAAAVRVGLMGIGEIARDASEVLLRLGFKVAGWSRSQKSLPGVHCFSGANGLAPFLAQTDILVCLLPLTLKTAGILDAGVFKGLARDGVLGAPVVINAGRGGLQVERDILACLDDGTLGAVSLDVFETEPLAAASPLWLHPKVTITPHNAADSEPDAISDLIVRQIRAFERGEPLRHTVDRTKGY